MKRVTENCEFMFCCVIQVLLIGDHVLNEGEWISLNGSTGEVILGKQPLAPPAMSGDLAEFMIWADQIRQMKVQIYGACVRLYLWNYGTVGTAEFMSINCYRLWQMLTRLQMH